MVELHGRLSGLKGSLSVKHTRGTTGRSAWALEDDAPTVYGMVESFVRALCAGEFASLADALEHDVGNRIAQEIDSLPRGPVHGTFYRARTIGRTVKLGRADFGPPPDGLQPPGRYTGSSREASVLYLSKDRATCAAEVPIAEGDNLYVQRFALDLPDAIGLSLPIDLAALAPFLNCLMLHSEVPPMEDSPVAHFQNPYAASHFVSSLCHHRGIAAVEFPSVRAGAASSGTNLVVFPPFAVLAGRQTDGAPVLWQA